MLIKFTNLLVDGALAEVWEDL